MACIFYLSSQSGTTSRAFSDKVMQQLRDYIQATTWLPLSIKEVYLSNPVVVTRKLAHFTIYMVLGLVSYLVFPVKLSVKKRIALVISLCLLYAVTDELHQLFVPDRNACVMDVLIDTFGSGVGVSIGWLMKK